MVTRAEASFVFMSPQIQTHKTNEVYGPAQIVLKEEEYQWAMQFLDVKDQLPGGREAKFFFFVSTPNPCKNLNNYFQEAWKTMGLPGCPTFTDIRTSIASHVSAEIIHDKCVKHVSEPFCSTHG